MLGEYTPNDIRSLYSTTGRVMIKCNIHHWIRIYTCVHSSSCIWVLLNNTFNINIWNILLVWLPLWWKMVNSHWMRNLLSSDCFLINLLKEYLTLYGSLHYWETHYKLIRSKAFVVFQGPPVRAQIAKFMGPTWDPPGSCRPQVGPMLAPWSLLSGRIMFVTTTHKVLLLSASVCVCVHHEAVHEITHHLFKLGSRNLE